MDAGADLCEDPSMRVTLVLCVSLSLGCDSRPDAEQPRAPAVASSDAEQFARWQDALEEQVEADARAGATRTFKDEDDVRRFLHSLTPAGFRPRAEFFAPLVAEIPDIDAQAERMAAYARAHPGELERRLAAFTARLTPLLEQVGANVQRQFPATAPLRWETDPAAALADARQRGRATVVLFAAEWAMAAKELERTFADPSVRKLLDQRFVAARVDVTDDQAPGVETHRETYAIETLPTVLVFDAHGSEVARQTGTMNLDELLALLGRAK
jgi:hypothetical protein